MERYIIKKEPAIFYAGYHVMGKLGRVPVNSEWKAMRDTLSSRSGCNQVGGSDQATIQRKIYASLVVYCTIKNL